MPTLVARSGPLAGRRYELADEVILGREDATITLADEETSRRHAAIRIVAGKAVIEDLGSTNGTFVDGRRIHTATELSGGETIKLGQTVFDVVAEVAPAPGPAEPGATRIATRPEAADPDRTALRPQPAAPEPAAPADPDRTARRPRPTAPEPPPEPVAPADPERTALRPRPAAEPPPAPPPAPDTERTTLRPRPGRPVVPEPPAAPAEADRTTLRPRPDQPAREPAPAAASARPAAPRAPARPAAKYEPPADLPFQPPGQTRRRGGVATRKLAPSLISFASILGTAVALVIYFIERS